MVILEVRDSSDSRYVSVKSVEFLIFFDFFFCYFFEVFFIFSFECFLGGREIKVKCIFGLFRVFIFVRVFG